jgi:hypothetical protein
MVKTFDSKDKSLKPKKAKKKKKRKIMKRIFTSFLSEGDKILYDDLKSPSLFWRERNITMIRIGISEKYISSSILTENYKNKMALLN